MAEFVPVLDTVPQFVVLQPEPVTVHVADWFVLKQTDAVNVCCAPSARFALAGVMDTAGLHAGAAIVTAAVADFDGSATLVAVIETVGVAGTVAGAVYVAVAPFVARVPHDAGHALPVRLQFTAVVGAPVPET